MGTVDQCCRRHTAESDYSFRGIGECFTPDRDRETAGKTAELTPPPGDFSADCSRDNAVCVQLQMFISFLV